MVGQPILTLAWMNGSQGRTEQRIRVIGWNARNATCTRKGKQKQSRLIRTGNGAWINTGIK